MDATLQTLGARLRWIREQAECTASELSDLAGLSRTHVGLIENGERSEPRWSTVEKIALVAGVSTAWLMAGDGAHPDPLHVRAAIERARALADLPATGTEGR